MQESNMRRASADGSDTSSSSAPRMHSPERYGQVGAEVRFPVAIIGTPYSTPRGVIPHKDKRQEVPPTSPKECQIMEISPRMEYKWWTTSDIAEHLTPEDGDRSNVRSNANHGTQHGALFLLYGPAHARNGRDDLLLPFHERDLSRVIPFFNIPSAFFQMLGEESTRCIRTTAFDEEGKANGFTFSIKYFTWWLGTGSLALSYDSHSGDVRVLILGPGSAFLQGDIFERVRANKSLTDHPFLVPTIVCDSLTKSISSDLDISTKRIFQLEQTIGVNDYGIKSSGGRPNPQEQPDFDFADINRSLNGELSRLANYEKFAKSHIALLETILTEKELSLDQVYFSFQIITQMREYVKAILGWNTELLARVECQQKIVDGQIQTLYNLLAQRDNKLNFTIAEASKRDSTAMKTIAVVTMVFLPGAYVATLFSMSMFDWHAKAGEHVLSNNFWVYWAVTLPITALVLLIWVAWSRPLRSWTSRVKS